jgi:transposase-like protein
MTKIKKIKCKNCKSNKTVKKGTRNGKNRYLCKSCKKYFCIDYRKKKKPLWKKWLNGYSLRTIAEEESISFKQVNNIIKKELKDLITCEFLSRQYCDRDK